MNDFLARRIAEALERLAQAEETRNILLERDIIDRKAAWRRSEERSAEIAAKLLEPQVGVPLEPQVGVPLEPTGSGTELEQ